jgi:putative oxidoreductase
MAPENSRGYEITLSALRFGFGLLLAWHHGRGQILAAWAHFLHGKDWDFIAYVARIGFPLPSFFALCVAVAEFFGGLLLGIGLLTRYAAALVTFNMGVAVFHHLRTNTGGELAWVYFLPALFFIFSPPGKWSVDVWWSRRKTTKN